MTVRLGLLTIGAAPRPDLAAPIRRRLPGATLVEAGALDGLTEGTLPPDRDGGYPLTTRLADGTPVTLDEGTLAPLVAGALGRLEAAGVAATLLLCAGPFDGLRGGRPVVRPFAVAVERLRAAGTRRIGVLVPVAGQVAPAERKCRAAGLDPVVVVGRLADLAASPAATGDLARRLAEADGAAVPPGALLLDYVGHDEALVERLTGHLAALPPPLALPLLDLGGLGADALASVAARAAPDGAGRRDGGTAPGGGV
ncbi:MAG: hypothetical protein RL338_1936 [Chloroflexota bacterium]